MGESVNRDENGHDDKGRFVDGNKGGGRPAVAREFREWCKEIMATEGRDRLLAALRTPQADYHFRVIELLAGYAYGKPKLGVELTGADGGGLKVEMSLPELERLVAFLKQHGG